MEQATTALRGNNGNVHEAITSLLGSQESSSNKDRYRGDRNDSRKDGGSFADRMENRYSDKSGDRDRDRGMDGKGEGGGDRMNERGSFSSERGGRGGGRGGRGGFQGERGGGENANMLLPW